MGKAFKQFVFQLFAGANITTIIAMLLVGYADRINPALHPSLANLGLLLPVMLSINLGFLVFWIFFHPKHVWIPLLGFLACYQPIRVYFPINLPKQTPEGAIKVLSYNVWFFGGYGFEHENNPVLNFIKEQGADIVCLQESDAWGKYAAKAKAQMDSLYPYHAGSHAKNKGDIMDIYSRHPIISQEDINYPSEGNHSTAFYLKIHGDTVIVINNHLESIGLSPEDKANFKGVVKGNIKGDSAQISTKTLIKKLGEASSIRAAQADAIAQYIAAHRDKSVILCGDFNDGPNSYARRTIAKQLRDCYIETANGPGISYHLGGFYVRIDHMMCSKDWTPYNCKIDNKIKASDHYPIYCWLKKAPNA